MDNIPLVPSMKAREMFDGLYRRIQGVASAQRLWERHLNDTEKKLLGPSFRKAFEQYPGAHKMWLKAKNSNRSVAVIDVAEKLNLITHADAEWLRREGGELPSDPDEAKHVAIERGDLVLSLNDKKLYWCGREYEVSFGKNPVLWSFLEIACRKAKVRESIGWDTFGAEKSVNYVAQTKSKLSKLPGFPIEVIDLFVCDGFKRQRLNLAPERIHLFD